ncbi:MAG: hypothetical protein ACLQBU_11915, partial [Terriglobales bacterium]
RLGISPEEAAALAPRTQTENHGISSGPAGSGQYRIAKGFEVCLLAFQHFLVIVDAKKQRALAFGLNRQGHGSPTKAHSQHFRRERCSQLLRWS